MGKKLVTILIIAVFMLLLVFALALAGHAQEPGDGRTGEGEGGVGQGLADPPPAGYTVLYMFTGAADDDVLPDPDERATVVHCTNFGDSSVNVQVEITNYSTIPTKAVTVAVDPGHTMTVASQITHVYTEDAVLYFSSQIKQGSGRIMADSSSAKLICTVQVVDPDNNPPEYMVNLDLFRP